jgi:hypothetical protein
MNWQGAPGLGRGGISALRGRAGRRRYVSGNLLIGYLVLDVGFSFFIVDVAVLVEHLDQGDQLFRGRRIVVMPHQLVRVRPGQ